MTDIPVRPGDERRIRDSATGAIRLFLAFYGTRSRLGRHMLRFGVVGIQGVLVNGAALYLLYRLAELPLVVASVLAVEMSIVHNYLLDDRWTFGCTRPSVRRFLKFNLTTASNLVVTPTVIWLLVSVNVNYLVASVLAVGAGALLNFMVSAAWVWKVWSPRESSG